VAKGGADGVQALGIRSRRLGIAIKIADGSARALQVTTGAVISQLGLLPADSAAPPARWSEEPIYNHAGRPTGRIMAVFELARSA
jgi:L-asparaginase II